MKHFKKVVALVVALFCFAGLTLTGCASNNSKTVTVVAYIEGVETERRDIDIFNNAILTPPSEDKIPEGKEFYGWSTSENWDETSEDFVVEGNFISYNNVKEHAVNGEVKLYPAYKVKVEKYFVFGWYTKTSTSGLNESTMSAIETALKNYLKTKGATDEQLALVDIRGYDGGVADYGAKIMADGDVDVFLGCGSNIDSAGGVTLIKKSSGMTFNKKDGRRFILLNTESLSIDVYNWFQHYVQENIDSEYKPVDLVNCAVTYSLGENAAANAVCPTGFSILNGVKFTLPEAVEAAEGYTFIGWKVGDTVYDAGASVSVSATTEIVAEFRSNALIEVSFSSGPKSRTSSTSPASQTITPGAEVTLPEAPIARAGFVFAGWRVGTELKAPNTNVTIDETTTITAEYTIDSNVNATIIVGYYAKSKTSGVTATIAGNIEAALREYLTSIGITDLSGLVVKGYGKDLGVDDTVTEIESETAGSVGVFMGFKDIKSLTIKDKTSSNITLGAKTDRNVCRLTDDAISNIIYDWMASSDSTFVNAAKTPA